ncbi:hypothetical protein BA939_03295 [Rhizobium sp. S41]|nr:hypothetical protein BA939_03295 [Rhizobium sp. S41]KGE80223.1 hypothetical protein LW14_24265 [Rhizobium sp. H41]
MLWQVAASSMGDIMNIKFMVAAAFCAGVLSGCQTAPQEEMIWLRTDGQSQVGNPHLLQQYEIDKTICMGEAQKSAVGAPMVYSNGSFASEVNASIVRNQQGNALQDVAKGCMAQRGYLLVPKAQAPAMAEQFRANAKKAN